MTARLQRQDAGTGAARPGVQPGRFSNSETSRLGRTLGFTSVGPYFVNGVEIVFPLDPGARQHYRSLRPRQWAGPEAVFFKTGQPLGSPWRTMSRGLGTGADDPLPQSQRVDNTAVIYDDSPGPSVLGHLGHTWIHVVQNFTGWVEGVPLSGGSPERLTPVVAWHSVISIVNPDAGGDGRGGGTYQPMSFTRSGTGWAPTEPPNL